MRTRFWTWRIAIPLTLLSVLLCGWLFGYPWWDQRQQRMLLAGCQRAQRTRQWDDLARLAETWSRRQPQSAEAWLFRADAAQQRGNFSAAADYLAAVPESSPKGLAALVALSTLQFGPANRPLDGVQTCRKILDREPLTAVAHQGLIEFYAMTMQRQELVRQVRAAMKVSRESPTAYVYLFLADSMRLANGVELNAAWLKTYPDTELFLVAEALQLPEPASDDAAVNQDKHARITSLSQRFPHNIELLAYQTDIAIRKGNVTELVDCLKRVPATSDGDDRFWRAKGWLHLNRNEISKARQALDRAMKLFPLDWNARNWLADVARREGKLDEADRAEKLVRQAKHLRKVITSGDSVVKVSRDILRELMNYAQSCGDGQLEAAIGRRLGAVRK